MSIRVDGNRETRRSRRGFTLVEMLVVILIISVVIAIVVPSVGGAKRAARKAVSQQLVTQVTAASTAFEQDNRRLPGYWSAKDMGNQANSDAATGGLSSMENLMLDLAGGVVSIGRRQKNPTTNGQDCPIVPATPFDVGTRVNDIPWVDVCQIGTPGVYSKGYFTPPAKYYRASENRTGLIGQAAPNSKMPLPDLLDAFGTPMLAWTLDDGAQDPVSGDSKLNNFARIDSTEPARFYWNSNAAFLQANAVGSLKTDQRKTNNASKQHSLVGEGVSSGDRVSALTAMLGAPGFPNAIKNITVERILPTAPRGRMIIQAASPDGFYFGSKSKIAGQSKDGIQFGYQHLDPGGNGSREKAIDFSQYVEDILAPVGG